MKLKVIVITLSLLSANAMAYTSHQPGTVEWAQDIEGSVDGLSSDVGKIIFTDLPAINTRINNEAIIRSNNDIALANSMQKINQQMTSRVDNEEAARIAGDAALKQRAAATDQTIAQYKADQAAVNQQMAGRADATDQAIAQHKADQAKVNQQMAGRVDNHETRITALEGRTNQRFADIDKRIGKIQDRADAGTASAIAMAATPQVRADQTFMVSAGAGTYGGQNALSVGASANAGPVVVKLNVSTDSQSNFGAGAGIGFGF